MTSVPTAVLVTQWVMLFALSALVIVTYRQLAHLLELSGSANDAGGPALGVMAGPFAYRRPGDPAPRTFTPGTRPVVLLFTDPRCGACAGALEAVERATRDRPPHLDVLVVTDAEEAAVAANEALGRTPFEVALVERRVVSHGYRVTGTPLLLGLDVEGRVRARAAGPDRSGVRRFLREFMRAIKVDTDRSAARPASSSQDEREVSTT